MVIINLKNLQVLVENIEFIICDDVKFYTKLIPCLMKYPNDSIVTVDDDILYTRDTLGRNLIFPCGVGAVLYHLIHWILL